MFHALTSYYLPSYQFRSAFCILLLLLVVLSTLDGNRELQATEIQEIERIFAVDKGSLGDYLEFADDLYSQASGSSPRESRLLFAICLTCIEYDQYEPAARLAVQSIGVFERNLGARIADFWLTIAQGRTADSLRKAEELSILLRNSSLKEQTELITLAEGFAYLEGSSTNSHQKQVVAEFRERIVGHLSGELQRLFLARHQQVLAQVEQLVRLNALQRFEAHAQKQIEATQIVTAIAEKNEQIEAVKQEATKVRNTAGAMVSQIDHQLVPLKEEYTKLATLARLLEVRMALGNMAKTSVHQAPGCSTGQHRPSGVAVAVVDAQTQYRNVYARGAQVELAIGVLQHRRRNLQTLATNKLNELNAAKDQLTSEVNDLARQQVEHRKPCSTTDQNPPTTGNHAIDFAKVCPFPVEEYKDCLLRHNSELDAYRALLISVGRIPEDLEYEIDSDGKFTTHDAVVILLQRDE
jgi:hypothetical protein